jgi:hypothetical protein
MIRLDLVGYVRSVTTCFHADIITKIVFNSQLIVSTLKINPLLYNNQGLFFDIIGENNSEGDCPLPPVVDTCPAGDTIAKGYLTYDGSLGETVFVDIQTTGTTFVHRTVSKDESISFGFDFTLEVPDFNLTEITIIVSNLDPDQGGSTVISKTLSTSCPGPWTIGSTIASVFVLNGFLYYDDEFAIQPVNINADGFFFGFGATSGWVRIEVTNKEDNCTKR